MTDESNDAETAVRQFLADADSALAEYDSGYADADATLRVLRRHLDDLRDAVPGDESGDDG
jgi:hypothetical protein